MGTTSMPGVTTTRTNWKQSSSTDIVSNERTATVKTTETEATMYGETETTVPGVEQTEVDEMTTEDMQKSISRLSAILEYENDITDEALAKSLEIELESIAS